MKIKQDVIEELSSLIAHLENNNIDYIISGSLAMNSYMIPRFTRDVDIVIDLKKESLNNFFPHFKSNFYLHENDTKVQVEKRGFFNALSLITGYKYDFIVQKNLEYEKLKFERKKRLSIFEVEAWVISLEDLIISKLNWMQDSESTIQRNDICALLEESPYLSYIRSWIKKLHLNTFDIF